MPAFSHDFLNRRKAASKLSLSRSLTKAIEIHLPFELLAISWRKPIKVSEVFWTKLQTIG
jgi:hypothetical protein